MYQEPFLDCCSSAELETVKILLESSHADEIVRRCSACATFWFYRFHEHVDFSGGDDEITIWYTQLTQEEAQRILGATGRPDLSFLTGKPSFVKDDQGVRRVGGQPTQPSPGG